MQMLKSFAVLAGMVCLVGCDPLGWLKSTAPPSAQEAAKAQLPALKADLLGLQAQIANLPKPGPDATAETVLAYNAVQTALQGQAGALAKRIDTLETSGKPLPWWQVLLTGLGAVAFGMYGGPALGAKLTGSAVGVVGDLIHRFLGGYTPVGQPGPDPGAPGAAGVIQGIVGDNIGAGLTGFIQKAEDALKLKVAEALRPRSLV